MLCYAFYLPSFLSDPAQAGGVGSKCWGDKEAWASLNCLHSFYYSVMLVRGSAHRAVESYAFGSR